MERTTREINSGRMQRAIAATGVFLLLASAIIAIGLAANSANAAWDSSPAGGKAAKKKNQVAVTETITVTVTVTTTGTALSTATRTQLPQATSTRTPNVEQTRTPRPTGTVSKVSVCHRTGSQTNPYVLTTISTSALPAHQQHGDIYPVPPGGCPQATPRATRTPRATNTPRPTATVTIQANRGNSNGHAGNNGNNGNAKANPPANSNNSNGNGNANPPANGNNGNSNSNGNSGKKGKP